MKKKMGALLLQGLFLLVFSVSRSNSEDPMSDEELSQIQRLLDDLLVKQSYDNRIRPIIENSIKTKVTFDLYLTSVTNVDSAHHIVVLDGAICLNWKDHRLTWNSSDYKGLKELSIWELHIWTPFIETITGAWTFDHISWAPALISNDGSVKHCPLVSLIQDCLVDLTNFPYDQQNCTMIFGTSEADGADVSLSGRAHLPQEDISPLWTISSVSSGPTTGVYPGIESAVLYEVSVVIKRKASDHYYSIVLPCAVITLLTLMIFWLPPSCDLKLTIGCINLLVILILLIHVGTFLKGSVYVPKVVSFLGGAMVTESVAMLVAVVVLNLSLNSIAYRPPAALMQYLTGETSKRVLCLRFLSDNNDDSSGLMEDGLQKSTDEAMARQEWYIVAQVIDRAMFVIFAITLAARQY